MFGVDTQNITNITNIVTFLGWSSSTRELLLTLNVFVVIFGLCGNGIVFYGSVKHHAIKMDTVTVMFIENLSALDFLITIVYYVPPLITLATKRWSLNKAVCFINAFLSAVLCLNEVFLVLSISCYRLWMLKKPSGVRASINKIHIKLFMLLIFLLAAAPVLGFIFSGSFAFYNPYGLQCIESYYYGDEAVYSTVVGGLTLVLPLVIILFTNIAILYIAVKQSGKVGGRVNRSTVVTISCICWGFILSYGPLYITVCLEAAEVDYPDWVEIFKIYMNSINIILNPIIYTATNSRFRRFMKIVCRCSNNNVIKPQIITVRPSVMEI